MSVLDRLPALATTGVGSLPFADAGAAVRHAAGAYVLPFCPQLPRHDGDMVSEWLGTGWAGTTSCSWTADRDRERPAAWAATLAALSASGGRPGHRLVKLQVTGPVTLAVALERASGRSGCGREVVALATEIGVWLAANAAEQTARLAELGLDAVVVVDEPGVAHAGLGAADVGVWDALARTGAAWGLHVCSQVPWAVVREAEPDLLSFDVTRYAVGGEGAAVLAELVARGSRVAWGALDPVRPDGVTETGARIAAAVGAVTAAGTPVDLLFERSLVTPACGTGRLSSERERLVAAMLAAAADVAAAAWRAWPAVPARR